MPSSIRMLCTSNNRVDGSNTRRQGGPMMLMWPGTAAYHRKQSKQEDQGDSLHGSSDEEGDAEAGRIDQEASNNGACRPGKVHESVYAIPSCSCRLQFSILIRSPPACGQGPPFLSHPPDRLHCDCNILRSRTAPYTATPRRLLLAALYGIMYRAV